jgi:putative colanic acid biosynthesis acetyltransferase WcaF
MIPQKKVDNASYKTSIDIKAGMVKQVCWYCINVFFFKNPFIVSSPLKVFLLRLFGASVGKAVVIKPSVNIKYPWKLTIGNHSWIGEQVWIDNLAMVFIGDNVCISQGAFLLTGNHNYKKTSFDLMPGTITIEEGVWIGAKAIVCPGVACASHSILSVASVAAGNLEPYGIYKGNPAVKINERIIE